jgi:hypothetical protein
MGFFAERPGPYPRPRPDDSSPNPYRKQWARADVVVPAKRKGREKPVQSLAEKIRHALQCK